MTPLLYRGGLTGSVYVATRHHVNEQGLMVADEKFDVTDQFRSIALCMAADELEESGFPDAVQRLRDLAGEDS